MPQRKDYALVQEFIEKFSAKNGSINCTELLVYDLRDPEQRKTSSCIRGCCGKIPAILPRCSKNP